MEVVFLLGGGASFLGQTFLGWEDSAHSDISFDWGAPKKFIEWKDATTNRNLSC